MKSVFVGCLEFDKLSKFMIGESYRNKIIDYNNESIICLIFHLFIINPLNYVYLLFTLYYCASRLRAKTYPISTEYKEMSFRAAVKRCELFPISARTAGLTNTGMIKKGDIKYRPNVLLHIDLMQII